MVKRREKLSVDRGDHRAKRDRLRNEKAQKKQDALMQKLAHAKVLSPKVHRVRKCSLVLPKPEVKKVTHKVVPPWQDFGSPQCWDCKAVQALEHLTEKIAEQPAHVIKSRGLLPHVLFMETFYDLIRYKPIWSRGSPRVADA